MTWQDSYNKWSGNIWARMEKLVELDGSGKGYAFDKVLWCKCAYCYYCGNDCTYCPLMKIDACYYSRAALGYITSQMYDAWLHKEKARFYKLRKQMLKALIDTKF